MYLKAGLFLVVGALASAGILLECPSPRVALLLSLAVWGFARAYYFAFYVVEHYIDGAYKYAGLGSFLRHLLRRRRGGPRSPADEGPGTMK
jgi:hypothetical protein